KESTELCGLVFYLLDAQSIYRIYQYGRKTDFKFGFSEVYRHGLGYIPAKRLGGRELPESSGGDVVYESYFMSAIPNLNKALKLDSTLDISINKMAYPVRAYYEAPCNNHLCQNGKVRVYDAMNTDAMQDVPPKYEDCPVCHGHGQMTFSPMRDYVHTPRGGFNNEKPIPFPGFAYISPDPSILAFNEQKITAEIEKAFMFMNIDVSLKGSSDGAAKTATESKIDREELFSFLLTISEELFALLGFTIDTIFKLRYPINQNHIAIYQPLNFDIRGVNELTQELAQAQANNVPDMVKRELIREYMCMRFPARKDLERLPDIIFYCDPLAARTTDEVITLKQQGLITPADMALHLNLFYFMEQQLYAEPDYLDFPLEQIRRDMVRLADMKARELEG
ncbi:MAG TPA: hypothetical protein VG603_06050, partial [Chitinophagales bacterium]|nr:hypothetical protein [Chitinophagales bacterium]